MKSNRVKHNKVKKNVKMSVKKKAPLKTLAKPYSSHPFEVGKQYQNRDGAYHVVSINDPNMVIRYLDGLVIESSIVLQARIWENIQESGNSDLSLGPSK